MRIRTILTDNAKEFTDRLFGLRKRAPTGEHEFDKLCADLDIDHRLTPPKSPQTNGMVERFNGRIEEVLQSHHFRSGEELEATLHRYVWLYNQQLPQSALGSRSPLQAMKDWYTIKPKLFKKRPYYLPGCDKIAMADGALHPAEKDFLHKVATIFGFADIDFDRVHHAYTSPGGPDPYEQLGLGRDSSDYDLKAAHRKLSRENHPDTLIAKGMPPEFIQQANHKMARINAAWDQIRKERNIR